jgi:hypothetical protein
MQKTPLGIKGKRDPTGLAAAMPHPEPLETPLASAGDETFRHYVPYVLCTYGTPAVFSMGNRDGITSTAVLCNLRCKYTAPARPFQIWKFQILETKGNLKVRRSPAAVRWQRQYRL